MGLPLGHFLRGRQIGFWLWLWLPFRQQLARSFGRLADLVYEISAHSSALAKLAGSA
jgi:hypothetical protein